MRYRFEREVEKALSTLKDNVTFKLDVPEDYKWNCLSTIVFHAVYTIQGTGDTGAKELFFKLFEKPVPSIDDKSCPIKVSEFLKKAKSHGKYGHIWRALFSSQAPYESDPNKSRVFGPGGKYDRKFNEFCKSFGLSRQWLGRASSELRIRKVEGSCQVISFLLTEQIETRGDLVKRNFERRLRVFGLKKNFFEQLRRHCGDKSAVKADKRIKEFAAKYLPFRLQGIEDCVRIFVEEMARKAGIAPVDMDRIIHAYQGEKKNDHRHP